MQESFAHPSRYLKCLNAKFSKFFIMSSWPGWNCNCFRISIKAKQKMNSTADSRRWSWSSKSTFDFVAIFSILLISTFISASDNCLLCHANNVSNNDGRQCSATVPKAQRSWSNWGSSPRCNSLDRFLSDDSNITPSIFFSACFVKSANKVRITISPGRRFPSFSDCISIKPAAAAIDDLVCIPQGKNADRVEVDTTVGRFVSRSWNIKTF